MFNNNIRHLILCSVCVSLFPAPLAHAETMIVAGDPPAQGAAVAAPAKKTLVIEDDIFGEDSYPVEGTTRLPVGRGYDANRVMMTHQANGLSCLSDVSQPAILMVQTGDILSDRLREWAASYGYDLVWEASELLAQGRLVSRKGFIDTLTDLKRAMELNGIDLEITTFENCVVRVVEIRE